jgi:uncharacterized repeat protein (TIGR03803 family)
MKKNRFWAAMSRALAVVTIALIVILMLAPGASAAAKYKVIHQFTGSDGSDPHDTAFVFDAAGNLYGSTGLGGAYGNGAVFELTPNADGTWTESVLYSFTGGSDGASPWAGVIFDASGNLYGGACNGGDYGAGLVFMLTPNSSGTWTQSVLYSFTGGDDGGGACNPLVFDSAGALYGTAGGGPYGEGVVFKLTPNSDGTWTESVLYSFQTATDSNPNDLVFDASGNLYGTTNGEHYSYGCGLAYELIPQPDGSWQYKLLHHFDWNDRVGYSPGGSAVVFDQAGSLYSATAHGALSGKGCTWLDCGTVFKLTPDSNGKWREHVLYRFKGGRDAEQATAGVVFDAAGNIWGTTLHGGSGPCSDFWGGSGCGTVYELTPNGHGRWRERVVHRFRGPAGGNPWGGLVIHDGKIYGPASGEGTSGSNGSVFEITP